MLFRPTIGTWCKGTTFMGGTEKVTIAITCKLLASNCNLLVVILFPKYKNY